MDSIDIRVTAVERQDERLHALLDELLARSDRLAVRITNLYGVDA